MNLNDLRKIFMSLRSHCDLNENILKQEKMEVKTLLNSEKFLNREEICSRFHMSKDISVQDAFRLTSKDKCLHSYKYLWSSGYFPNQLKESIICHILEYECSENCPFDIVCDTFDTVLSKYEIINMKQSMSIPQIFQVSDI